MEEMANSPLLANDYADWFINATDRSVGNLITVPMVHKLVYLAQAWYLANKNRSLFTEDFRAWSQGPMLPTVQKRFENYSYTAIPVMDSLRIIRGEKLELVESIQERYGRYSASGLEMHVKEPGGPWAGVRGCRSAESACDEVIPKEAMRRFYGEKLAAARL